ncbi:MAG: hypothetical protein ABR587_06205 [Candidatus Binatia bacterium]
MKGQNKYRMIMAAAALVAVAGVTESRADGCSASSSSLVTRSSGGTCGAALSLDDVFTLTYRITNASIIDDNTSPNDGDPIEATIFGGNEMVATLAQETSLQGATELPTVLEFVPVCPADSSLNAGNSCDPNLNQCGTGTCGCESNLPGVTCEASGANKVNLEFAQDIVFNGAEQRTIATIRVRLTDTVSPPATCGEFFTRVESTGDIITTTDDQCDSEVTADSQASADLHAPECASDDDCGECQVCADLATDPHCENAIEGTACTEDDQDCTIDQCDIDGNCVHTENDAFCDDQDACTTETCSAVNGCVYEFICEAEAICRSPGYWATHSGYQKSDKSINVGQLVIDTVGPIEVCGQVITETSNESSPYLDGLGLDSNLEGLCMRAQGVPQRRLYRHLVAAAFNCAVSGGDCETVSDPFVDVSFDECSDVCAGIEVVDGPTMNECASQFDCFNNGGQIINGECAFGTCAEQADVNCGGDFGDCPLFEDSPQECVNFPGNCHDAVLCNEELGICPKGGPASSPQACREARGNSCTIDDCD